MYRILVACRAEVGSGLVSKIKINQIIGEYRLPIEIKHANPDRMPGFDGGGIFTLSDVAIELKAEYLKWYIVEIQNIMDKANLLEEVQMSLKAKEDE